ncbi:alpha/beta hydrolase [Microbacterium sp. NPDC058345]|uniref:alpha/beta hydrolase n=1 Tax=Microbacterium sp. NPDC058345 TaxID=3346455 RepID=UPI003656C3B7
MQFGYVLIAVCTAAALISPRRPRGVGVAAFFLGMVVNELPQVALLYLLGTAGLALVEDDLLTPGGLVGIAVACLSTLGLIVLALRGMRSRAVVSEALHASGIAVATADFRSAWLSLVAPLPVRPRSVRRIKNIPYGPHPKQRLDVYRRDDTTAGPVLVYLHGGGYSSGSKHWEGRALLHRLAARGWVCISADYRLRPEADFADHLDDARSVLSWAQQHARQHGGDAGTLVMAGSSAGAHLTAHCALQPQQGQHLDAAVCMYGYLGRYYGRGADERPISDPLALDATDAPPTFVAHGDHDTYVPVEGARAFVEHLRAASDAPVVYAELPGGQHAFDLFASWRGAAVVDGVEAFLSRVTGAGKVSPARARDLHGTV